MYRMGQEEIAAVSRVLAGEPLAYILGEWDFYGMTLSVDQNVLIPRDDTCAVADLAINRADLLGTNPRILDLCTGSGCVAISVLKHTELTTPPQLYPTTSGCAAASSALRFMGSIAKT